VNFAGGGALGAVVARKQCIDVVAGIDIRFDSVALSVTIEDTLAIGLYKTLETSIEGRKHPYFHGTINSDRESRSDYK
jgi:hypothetical protein